MRERTANAVLSLLGRRRGEPQLGETADLIAERATEGELFTTVEHEMIESVLTLADRPAKSVMTPRLDIDWLDIDDSDEELRRKVIEMGHSRFPVARGSLDEFLGIALTKDLLRDFIEDGRFDFTKSLRQPLVVHESISALRLLEQLRKSPVQVAMVLDEFGSLEGMVTPTDLLEAIAGDFADEDGDQLAVERGEDGSLLVDGWIDIRHVSKLLDIDLVDDADRYSTLAGLILWRLGHMPVVGETVLFGDMIYEVVSLDVHMIEKVKISKATRVVEVR